jgi:hypothetical protein
MTALFWLDDHRWHLAAVAFGVAALACSAVVAIGRDIDLLEAAP